VISIEELPKVMKAEENSTAYQMSHQAKKIDEIVRWINKQESKMTAVRKAMKAAGHMDDEDEPQLDTNHHPMFEQK
jgi:hypothetical protein